MKDNHKINWGILATGKIAGRMADALTYVENSNLLAVASRSLEKAKQFAAEKNIPKFYGSYEELVADPEINLIYIATPVVCHYENIMLCLNNGKNVLCEKPFTLNEQQAREAFALAKGKNLFLMEAHWSQFLPGIIKVKDIIKSNIIGKISSIQADFCYKPVFDPANKWFNLELGGGALLDLGVYPIALAISVSDYPVNIESETTIGNTGVDIFNTINFQHENASKSVLTCGINAQAPVEALITGENGYIKIPEYFHHPHKIILKTEDNLPVEIDVSYVGNGLNYQAVQVNKCLMAGMTVCPEFPPDKTLEILKIIDLIRKKCNLKYPQEN